METDFIQTINSQFNEVINDLRQAQPNHPISTFRRDRLIGKWVYAENSKHLQSQLNRDAERDFLRRCEQYYASGIGGPGWFERIRNQEVRETLWRFKLRCRALGRSFRPCYSIDSSYVGPGSNFNYDGPLDEVSKLTQADSWPVHPQARKHLWEVVRRDRRLRLVCLRKARESASGPLCVLSKTYLLKLGFDLMSVDNYRDKLVGIPKNAQKSRVIAVASIGDQVADSSVAFGIYQLLESIGCWIRREGEDAQEAHKKAISLPSNSTIDFSAASDSVLKLVVQWLFGDTPLGSALEDVSVRQVFIDEASVSIPMQSTMGRRVTFPLMTLMLATLAQVISGTRTERSDGTTPQVFGDDVIIANEHAKLFIACCEAIGFKVNKDKTFISSEFRESCGAFYTDKAGYITSYDSRIASSWEAAIALVNKLLICFLHEEDSEMSGLYYRGWCRLKDLVPAEHRGPVPSAVWASAQIETLGLYCYDTQPAPLSQSFLLELGKRFNYSCLFLVTTFQEKLDVRRAEPLEARCRHITAYRDRKLHPPTGGTAVKRQKIVVTPEGSVLGSVSELKRQQRGINRGPTDMERFRYACWLSLKTR